MSLAVQVTNQPCLTTFATLPTQPETVLTFADCFPAKQNTIGQLEWQAQAKTWIEAVASSGKYPPVPPPSENINGRVADFRDV